MNGCDQNRWTPTRLAAPSAHPRPDATAAASDSDSDDDDDDDDDYIDAGSSFQQQVQPAYIGQPAMRYVQRRRLNLATIFFWARIWTL